MEYVIIVIVVIAIAVVVIRKQYVKNGVISCVRCLVRLERQEQDYAYYRMVDNPNVRFKISNAYHIRLVENWLILPESFYILAPSQYVNIVEGSMPIECYTLERVGEYLALRKRIYGE